MSKTSANNIEYDHNEYFASIKHQKTVLIAKSIVCYLENRIGVSTCTVALTMPLFQERQNMQIIRVATIAWKQNKFDAEYKDAALRKL